MDNVTNTKIEFRIKQWTKIVQACQSSGMTGVAWCAQHDINIKSYYYWLQKLRSMVCQAENLPAVSKEQSIVPLSIKPNTTLAISAITIRLPAASIDINNGASRETIEAVLYAVKTIC